MVGDLQKAAVRACRNAIEFNSIPCVEQLVPGGRNGLKLMVKVGTPRHVRSPCGNACMLPRHVRVLHGSAVRFASLHSMMHALESSHLSACLGASSTPYNLRPSLPICRKQCSKMQ